MTTKQDAAAPVARAFPAPPLAAGGTPEASR